MPADCTHLDQVRDVTPRTPAGCEECLQMGGRWVHLRLCLICGHVGCCDSSPNKHATKHFHATSHPVVRSFEPGEDWGWCYADEPSWSRHRRRREPPPRPVTMPADPADARWPALPLEQWRDTYATLHLWTPDRRQDPAGAGADGEPLVAGRALPHRARPHHLADAASASARSSSSSTLSTTGSRPDQRRRRAQRWRWSRAPLADFYADYLRLLRDARRRGPRSGPCPSEIPDAIPFAEDRPRRLRPRGGAALLAGPGPGRPRVQAFRGRFLGKCSPVALLVGRASTSPARGSPGAPAPPHPGGIPNLARPGDARGLLARVHQRGLVAGTPGGRRAGLLRLRLPGAAGLPEAAVRPAAARYDPQLREWILPYEAVRTAADPDAVLLEFLESTYAAAADLGGWDRAALERSETLGEEPGRVQALSPG